MKVRNAKQYLTSIVNEFTEDWKLRTQRNESGFPQELSKNEWIRQLILFIEKEYE